MKKKLFISSLLSQAFFIPVTLADTPTTNTPSPNVNINENLKSPSDLVNIIQQVGGWLLMIAGALAVVFLVIGGIRYITSAGNATQTEGAKKTIIWALVGIIIIALSYFLVVMIPKLLPGS